MAGDQSQDDKPIYNKLQLQALIASARKLGFWDDVAYFERELAKLS